MAPRSSALTGEIPATTIATTMPWQSRREGELQVLSLGESLAMDSRQVDAAIDQLCQIVTRQPSLRWAVMASSIPMLGSANIARLITLVRQLHTAGGKLILVAPLPAVSVVLMLARLDRLLPMKPDLAAAAAD